MFSIKSFVNKITDKGTGRESTGAESSASFVETEEQHSAEGFLCPQCMRAFPSPESLEEHYNKSHNGGEGASAVVQSNGDIQDLRQEILNLQSSLAEERTTSEELKREVLKMQIDFQSRDDDNVSSKSQERELEEAKSFFTSEVTLLRMQLTTSMEQNSQLKKEKDILGQKILGLANDNDNMKIEITSLETQLAHRNSVDDAEVLRQELVSVQRMMDQLALEKEKEIEILKAKLEELETKMDEKERDVVENSKIAEVISNHKLVEQQLNQEKKDLTLQIETLQKTTAAELSQKVSEIENIKSELSNVDRKRESAENDCSTLRNEVQRLTEQHTELYDKIEGGEGAKAALTALQKENEVIKQNLDSVHNQNRELSKNLHNLKIEVEKSQSEHKKLTEAHAAEADEWEAKRLLFKEQLQSKEAEMQHAIKKHDELLRTIQTKDGELKNLKTRYANEAASAVKFQQSLESSGAKNDELQKTIEELKLQINSLSQDFSANKDIIKQLTEAKADCLKKLEESELRFTELKELLAKSEAERLSTEEKSKTITEQTTIEIKNLKQQIDSEVEKCKQSEEACLQIKQELQSLQQSSESEKADLKLEIEAAVTASNDAVAKISALESTIEETKTESSAKVTAAESKMELLQIQRDEIFAEKIELEKKSKSSEEEKSLLLERCLSGESESERLKETINELRRKQDDALAALQELGRENQSLQMESAKLQGRKWADDSAVNTCSTCSKEFSLTVRKHHCRKCGSIFCHECSSRTASVPSSKKPVRVCDACYMELTSK